ncbi:hypothetical protein ROJ8625_00724 [Roseivivax jejudonensis]|uniref:Uncharacterized protein n=1 Tax=Roseivivax jejudonensis TaxID=1529041 RepID=A0A1X6YGA1_9RHOB|nr:hypothetical protein [Roseivivax jejudonensis]SLN20227.1 hypothetical protein ROJ8625_00724 [Roseivivax jejudonensis]
MTTLERKIRGAARRHSWKQVSHWAVITATDVEADLPGDFVAPHTRSFMTRVNALSMAMIAVLAAAAFWVGTSDVAIATDGRSVLTASTGR